MSADNGVYIAQWSDQSRVIEAGAIDNLNWHFAPTMGSRPEANLSAVWQYYHRAKPFTNHDKLMAEATRIFNDLSICEYGICIVYQTTLTWDEFLIKAKEKAQEELDALVNEDERWDHERQTLRVLIDPNSCEHEYHELRHKSHQPCPRLCMICGVPEPSEQNDIL